MKCKRLKEAANVLLHARGHQFSTRAQTFLKKIKKKKKIKKQMKGLPVC
jgi:uncharacterized protein YihD (DUF1040 family)